MLKNKSEKTVKIKYNGFFIEVPPSGILDVRDFDIPNAAVKGAERHITNKNPGVFELIDFKEVANTKESARRIAELEEANAELTKLYESAMQNNKRLQEAHGVRAQEIETARKEVAKAKDDLIEALRSRKELEDEIRGLREQMVTPKPKAGK
jgi:DNA repair exonuclease SbcCD ATPase subunit